MRSIAVIEPVASVNGIPASLAARAKAETVMSRPTFREAYARRPALTVDLSSIEEIKRRQSKTAKQWR